MKIKLLSISHYSNLYGANRSLLDLLVGLKEKDILPFVLIPKSGPICKELERNNIPYKILSFGPSCYLSYNLRSFFKSVFYFFLNFYYLFVLVKFINKNKINVIHSNSSVILLGILGSIITRIPHILHIREFTKEHYQLKRFPSEGVFKFFAIKSKAIISISKVLSEYYAQKWGLKDIPVIYNGVIRERTPYRKNYLLKGKIEILMVGKISKEKNQEEGILAVNDLIKSYPEFHISMTIVGDTDQPSYYNKLLGIINENGLINNIKFVGFVKNVNSFYNKADLFLMCSRHEGLGRVTIEAMSYGVPVIGFKGGATPEIIIDGKTGLLYQEPHELTSSINNLIRNQRLRKCLAHNAKEYVEEKFSQKSYVDSFYQLLESFRELKLLPKV